jgi:hypothetical protein
MIMHDSRAAGHAVQHAFARQDPPRLICEPANDLSDHRGVPAAHGLISPALRKI